MVHGLIHSERRHRSPRILQNDWQPFVNVLRRHLVFVARRRKIILMVLLRRQHPVLQNVQVMTRKEATFHQQNVGKIQNDDARFYTCTNT